MDGVAQAVARALIAAHLQIALWSIEARMALANPRGHAASVLSATSAATTLRQGATLSSPALVADAEVVTEGISLARPVLLTLVGASVEAPDSHIAAYA